MYDEEYRPPAGENRPISLRGVQDDEAKRQDEGCLDPVDKKLNQSKEDAKAKLKGSRPDSNAASATISSSGPAYIDNDMKTMPLPSEQDNPDKVSKARAARPSVQSSTSSAKKPTSTARSSVADKEAKAMARSQMVPSRVKRESGEANAKVLSSQEQLVADEEAKASVRNSMVPSRVRRSRGGDGDDELAAATVMEATVFPGSPSAIEDEEEEDSILPGAQKVHGPGAKLEANLNFDDLEATPSEKDDGRPAPGDKDNLEHATAIVAELVPTDTDVSEQLQKMVEDRFNQERKRQVVVEAVQAEPMGNDEQGGKICGVIVSKKYWLLLVVGLLVLVAVAVGAGVLGAAGGGDSGNSGPPKPRPIGVDNGDNDDNDGPEAPTAAPSISRRVELLEAIGATILENDPNALEPGTPTAQALNWMANVDEANLDFTTTRSSVLVERYALAAFYFATNGPTWFNRYNFLEATSVCSWNSVQSIAGVFCNGLSVQQIYFTNNAIEGPLPPQLGLLTRLTTIYFPDNQLTGTFPTELASLQFLSMLYLTSNRLSGTIPTEIGLFPNLSDGLAISDNEFASGTLPTEIGKLTNIDFIDMSLCNLSGAIPSQIGLLTKLDSLNLQMNELTGVVPVELESLQSLTFLLLEYNLLTGDLATSPLCQQLDTFAADCSTGCTCCINSELCR